VGNGVAAKIHRQNFPNDTKVLGLVVRNIKKHKEKVKGDENLDKDIFIVNSMKNAYELVNDKDFIWDVSASTEEHYNVLTSILSCDPEAKIMIEKPVGGPLLIDSFQDVVGKYPEARITITENYANSNITKKMKELIQKFNLNNPLRIIVEFTKNRIRDYERGRYICKDVGAFGYDSSHMLTIVSKLGEGKLPKKLLSSKIIDAKLSDGTILENQGTAQMSYETIDGSKVSFFTSMIGEIGHPSKELNFTSNIGIGSGRRYRILIIHDTDKDIKIIGQYEPIPNKKRSLGRILVVHNKKIIKSFDDIQDNTMKQHLEKQILYLEGKCDNPFPPESATLFKFPQQAYNLAISAK